MGGVERVNWRVNQERRHLAIGLSGGALMLCNMISLFADV